MTLQEADQVWENGSILGEDYNLYWKGENEIIFRKRQAIIIHSLHLKIYEATIERFSEEDKEFIFDRYELMMFDTRTGEFLTSFPFEDSLVINVHNYVCTKGIELTTDVEDLIVSIEE